MDIKNIKRYNSVIISQRQQFIFWLKMQIWWNNTCIRPTQLGIQIQTFYLSLFSFFQEHFFMLIFIRFISLYYPIKCRFPWKLNPPPIPRWQLREWIYINLLLWEGIPRETYSNELHPVCKGRFSILISHRNS